ncbi:energy transducer TonB, partial [bacterium]
HEACDAAAVRFAYQLRFRPGKQRDIPVPVYVSFPVVFRLSE